MTCILLTGSSRGIGAAAKASLEARGAQVIGHATKSSGSCVIAADFTEPVAPQSLWQSALKAGGGTIDVLINNAGLFDPNPVSGSDIEWLDKWEETLRINLT
ncbi:MAG: SDR family NAD(P)-dependent oxidoreductase, partial [Marinomonas sp.]